MNTSKVWYVTGAFRGLGLILVKKLLKNGYRAAATSRDASKKLADMSGELEQWKPITVGADFK